jgi:hypothetical protein
LQQTIRDFQKRLDESERSAKRQAAPFAKGEPKKASKKPGRKQGEQHGKHGHRPPPPPAQVDETLDAPLPSKCPDPNCGGNIVEDSTDTQFQTEIPREPINREFTIHCGHCDKCRRKVRGRHPLQTSAATGAAQSQLGPDAQATIVDLNKRAGMSHGKIADTFTRGFGISEDTAHQQCVDHALRRARGLLEKQSGAAGIFPRQVIELFTASLSLRDRLNTAHAGDDRRGQAYEDYTQRLLDLTKRPRLHEQNARLANHLYNHAPSWFLFLIDPLIPATNHRAEQALKTPIVNRKVWGGNRTLDGCHAQTVLCSVLQTCKNLAIDSFTYLSNAFRGVIGPLFA